MVISTHLPPPVMIESTASRALTTHMLCWSCAMCFSAAASSENDQGSMNLASNTAPLASTIPSRVAPIQRLTGWRTCRCTCVTAWPLLRSYQSRLRCSVTDAELDDEIIREVLRLLLAALLAPEPQQGGLVLAHDDPGIRAADEAPPVPESGNFVMLSIRASRFALT